MAGNARRTFCTLSVRSRAPYLRRWALIIALAPEILRRALFEERGDPLRIVVGRAEPRIRLALQLQRGLERRLRAPVDHHLERAERERCPLHQLAGKRAD